MAAGNAEPGKDSTEDASSAAKRRRRSEDRDVGEAAADTDGGSQGQAKGIVPVNGHAANGADGAVAPEAAFWSALEDAKDEVSFGPYSVCCTPLGSSTRRVSQLVQNRCKGSNQNLVKDY